MKKSLFCALLSLAALAVAGSASAHVTIAPSEALVGNFARFVVRVPNERDDAETVKVEVRFPPLAFVSFEPKEGWSRTIDMKSLDEPIVVFGNEITEVVGTVTWSGGRIAPDEFLEFGFSARTPDEESTLTFNAIQTYSSGEVVRWTGRPDSETPAPDVTTYDIGAREGQGELAVLARIDDRLAALQEGGSPLGAVLGAAGIVLALVAMVFATRKRAG